MTKFLLIALTLLLPVVTHADYERMRESLAPVVQECHATEGAIGSGVVLVNLLCSTPDENGEITWIEKRVLVNLVEKTWVRELGWFYLLD